MDAEMSPNLQSEPRRTNGIALVQAQRSENQKTGGIKSSLSLSQIAECWCSISKTFRQREQILLPTLLFYSGLWCDGWGEPTLGRAICFIQSTNFNFNLIKKHPDRHTQNNVLPIIWVPHGPIKLIHENNRHRYYDPVALI